mgnify:CR=1 FL=1
MKKLFVLVATAAAAHSAFAAETYNVEAGVQYQTQSTDDKTDLTATAIAGTYYLKPITIDGTQPFMELDVLQRASGISVRYANVSMETAALSKTTLNPVEVSGNFFVDDFVLGFNNSTWDKNFNLKSSAANYYGIKSTTTGFNVGYWVLPNTVVSFVNEKNEANYTRSSNSLSAIADVTNTTNGVLSHSVVSLGGAQSLVLDLGYKQVKREQTTSKTNTEYAAKVRYYPEAKYFFEGGYSVNSGDYDYNKGKAFMVGAGYAFTPRFAVLLSTEKFNGDVASEQSSGTSTTLTAGYRF